jgi:SAM-dependent methyltransferase
VRFNRAANFDPSQCRRECRFLPTRSGRNCPRWWIASECRHGIRGREHRSSVPTACPCLGGRSWKQVFENAWLDRFLPLQPPRADVLDIGCGSGEPIGRYLIEKGHAVTGADSSPELVEICRGHFPDQGWRVADMRTLSLAHLFNGILAWDSFFHPCPDDQRRMFPIFREHAAPRAALMFTCGPSHGEVIGSYRGEPLYHASLGEPEYRSLLDSHGFDVVSHVVEDPNCGGHTIWLAQSV